MENELAKAYTTRVIKTYDLEDTPLLSTRMSRVSVWLFRHKQNKKLYFISADQKGGGVSGGLDEGNWEASSNGKLQFIYGYSPADTATITLDSTRPIHYVDITRAENLFLIATRKTAVTITFKDSQDNSIQEIKFKGWREDDLLARLSYWLGKPLYTLKILRPPQDKDGAVYLHRKRDLIASWFKK